MPQQTPGEERTVAEARGRFAVSCVNEIEMTLDTDQAIRRLLCECFPDNAGTFSQTRRWHGSGPEYSIVYAEEDCVLGHVGVVVREILCDGVPVRIAGVQNVAVSPSRRRTGLSRQAMQASMAEAASRGIPYGMLFCAPELEHFYRSLGWQRIEAAITTVNEDGTEASLDGKNIAMVKVLYGTPFTARDIHLQGADW
jgi:predicted acetyltransferase